MKIRYWSLKHSHSIPLLMVALAFALAAQIKTPAKQAAPAPEPPSIQTKLLMSGGGGFMVNNPNGTVSHPSEATASLTLTASWPSGDTKTANLAGEFRGQAGASAVFRTKEGVAFVVRAGRAYPAVTAGTSAAGDPVVAAWRANFRRVFTATFADIRKKTPDEQAEDCENMGELAHPESATMLRSLLQSPSEKVRDAAKAGLSNWTALNKLVGPAPAPAVKKK